MKTSFLFLVICSVAAAFASEFEDYLTENFETSINEYDDDYQEMDRMLSLDWDSISLDPSNPIDLPVLEHFAVDPKFIDFREKKIASFGMSIEDFDDKFENGVELLLEHAIKYDITIDRRTTSYDQVMSMLFHAGATTEDVYDELLDNAYLYKDYNYLIAPRFQDVQLRGLSDDVNNAIRTAINVIQGNKCGWCMKTVDALRTRVCNEAGKHVCNLIAGGTGVFAPLVKTYACGFPFNVASIFGRMCSHAVQLIQSGLKLTDKGLCQRVSMPSITLHAHRFIGININYHHLPGGGCC